MNGYLLDTSVALLAVHNSARLEPLLLSPDHIAALHDLPFHHNDPFDRALLAQATVAGLTFLTTDASLDPYASDRLRVVR